MWRRAVLRWSLAHEWSHVERHDFRAWLMAGLVRLLFFYQPLAWWLRRQLRLCQDFLPTPGRRESPQTEDYAEFLTACVPRHRCGPHRLVWAWVFTNRSFTGG